MTNFESPIKHIAYPQEKVYAKLADLNNLEAMKDKLPADKIQNFNFDSNHVSFSVPGMGNIQLEVAERTPYKCIKFASTNSPIAFNLWIQIVPDGEGECKIRITAGVEVNMFMKSIVSKPIKEGLEKMVEVLSVIPY
jgi:carbon monoxide dehydrogenase subunit G